MSLSFHVLVPERSERTTRWQYMPVMLRPARGSMWLCVLCVAPPTHTHTLC